jgi:hypothetical protein
MTVWLPAALLLILGVVILAVAIRAGAARRAPAPTRVPAPAPEEGVTGEPKPIPPRWPRRVDLDPDLLDDATRAGIIDSLTALGDPWAIGVLAQAYEEERDPALRLRILEELRNAAIPEAQPTLERAARSAEPPERSLAYEGLAQIGAFDAVERGLDDQCIAVAQSACLALMRAGARDRVTIYLRQADPERAAALRVVIDAIELR